MVFHHVSLGYEGLIGAATVIGSLQHGGGVCESVEEGSPLSIGLKARSPEESKNDTRFLHDLRYSATSKQGQFPPVSLAQIYIDRGTEMAKLRRLHLINVDLLHPRRSASRTFQYVFDTMCRATPRPGGPGGGCGPPRGMSGTGRGGPVRVRRDVKLRYSAGVMLKTPVPNEP